MTKTTYTIIELGVGGDGRLGFSEKAKLTVMHVARHLRAYPALDGFVALVDDALCVTFIWDPIRGAYAVLPTPCLFDEHKKDAIQVG